MAKSKPFLKFKKQYENYKVLVKEVQKTKNSPILIYFFLTSVLEQIIKTAVYTQLCRMEEKLNKESLKFNADVYFETKIKKVVIGKLIEEIKIFTTLNDFEKEFGKNIKNIFEKRNDIVHHLLDNDLKELEQNILPKLPELFRLINRFLDWNMDLLEKHYDDLPTNN